MKIKNIFKTKIQAVISVAGLALMLIWYANWAINGNTANKAGNLAALVSLLLFLIVCLEFVPRWLDSWTGKNVESTLIREANCRDIIEILIMVLITSMLYYICVRVLRVIKGDTTTFIEGLNIYLNLDTGNYLNIAEYLYDIDSPAPPERIVFYPAFPLLIRLFNSIIGNYLISAICVSILFYALSAIMLYKLLLIDYDAVQSKRAIKYLLLIPGAFFFAFPMSESLFFFNCIASIYYARNDKWVIGCVFGALAAFTRSLGALILAPLVFEAISQRRHMTRRIFMCLFVVVGLVGYLAFNYFATGDAFAFSKYEASHWGQEFGSFFNTAAYQMDNALADIQTDYYTSSLGIWIPNIISCFAVLVLAAVTGKYVRPSYMVWFILYYFFAIAPTFLISAPRYLVACVPVYVMLATITKNKKVDIALTFMCILGSLYYIFAFANLWNVY